MKYVVTIDNKSYEVEVEKGAAQLTKVTVASPVSAPVAAPVSAPAAVPAAPAAAAVSTDGCEMIESPMPGVVVDIKKEVGTRVKRGEILLILEAMKMENEIAAPRDGTVAQIFTSKGASVTTGAPLLALR